MRRINARCGQQTTLPIRAFNLTQNREWYIVTVLRQAFGRKAPRLSFAGGVDCPGGKVSQSAEAAFSDHLLRCFHHGGENASNFSGLNPDWSKGKREIALLRIAVPPEQQQ